MTAHPVQKPVVIVGGGFGGYYAAHDLARHGQPVTIVDTLGHQTFQPMLYQAATGLISLTDLQFDLAQMDHVDCIADSVTAVDLASGTLSLAGGASLQADHLVLATGSTVNFFGVAGAAEHAFPLYTGADAQAIKHRLQQLIQSDSAIRVVTVGAGATGVEITGALVDVLDDILPHSDPQFHDRTIDLHLVDHAAAPLESMSRTGQEFAASTLTQAGVTLHMGREVTEVTAEGVVLDDGTHLPADLVIWAGGLTVTGPVLNPQPQTGRSGRIIVEPDLRIAGFPMTYCIGDAAADRTHPLPQLGSVAKQQGVHTGRNIRRQLAGKDPKPFHYRDMGDMAMVRHDAAVVEMGSSHHPVTGPVAFGMWLGLHAYLLPGEKHRVDALHDWAHELRTGQARFLFD